jgi:hypothetical protein
MKRFMQITVAALLVVLVLAVFVSPAVNLPKTALRSQQSALILLIGMMLAASRILAPGIRCTPELLLEDTGHPVPYSGPSALIQVLLC